MKYYSTRDPGKRVPFGEAVLNSLSSDGGLYMPEAIPVLDSSFFSAMPNMAFDEIGAYISKLWIDDIDDDTIVQLIKKAFDFDPILVEVEKGLYSLELFHGPSMAFKDFGARFMAQFMSYYNEKRGSKLNILVATSGDTGGAVASGFFGAAGIDVFIFYPKGKVSKIQERQLTTWAGNIRAVEVDGTFDDCQAIVKQAFVDEDLLNQGFVMGSANSINIARLLPQSFYYFDACKHFSSGQEFIFAVPSGNFGNLTAGLFAKRMGLPIKRFIAATNVNNVVPEYIKTGFYKPKQSVATISNAMDVGNPSNFERIMDLNCSTWNNVKSEIEGYSLTDEKTKQTIIEANSKSNYILDPHGAIAYQALKNIQENIESETPLIFLETAHYGKFLPVMQSIIKEIPPLPEKLLQVLNKKTEKHQMTSEYAQAKEWLREYMS